MKTFSIAGRLKFYNQKINAYIRNSFWCRSIFLNCCKNLYKFSSYEFSVHQNFVVGEILIWIDKGSNWGWQIKEVNICSAWICWWETCLSFTFLMVIWEINLEMISKKTLMMVFQAILIFIVFSLFYWNQYNMCYRDRIKIQVFSKRLLRLRKKVKRL